MGNAEIIKKVGDAVGGPGITCLVQSIYMSVQKQRVPPAEMTEHYGGDIVAQAGLIEHVIIVSRPFRIELHRAVNESGIGQNNGAAGGFCFADRIEFVGAPAFRLPDSISRKMFSLAICNLSCILFLFPCFGNKYITWL